MSNCTLLGGVFQVMADPGVVRVAYYFVGSQTVAALIYATLNLPPGLLILLFGQLVHFSFHSLPLPSRYLVKARFMLTQPLALLLSTEEGNK
ncbi:hypothetical protein TSMEX_008444 [Taenia solium]|eukprot:TsM_001077400 transcript=TsM_001077400 gene=TsM_001077400